LLRRPLAISILLTVTCVPIFVLYLRQMLHVPSNLLSAYVFMATLGSALSFLTWGRLADHVGFRPMLAGLLWLAIATAPLVLFLRPMPEIYPGFWNLGGRDLTTVLVLWLMGLLTGAVWAGIGIAATAIEHYHVESTDSLEAMGLHQLSLLAAHSVVAYLSGWFLEEVAMPAGAHPWLGGLLELDWVKVYLAAVVPLLYLLTLTQVLRLPARHPHYRVADFFLALLGNPVRGITDAATSDVPSPGEPAAVASNSRRA
jgi:MFS family permease